jgi:hypothetical protein
VNERLNSEPSETKPTVIVSIGPAVRTEAVDSMEGALYEARQGWSGYDCGPAALLSIESKLNGDGRKLALTVVEARWLAEHLSNADERLEHPDDRPLGRACGRTAERIRDAIRLATPNGGAK